MKKIITLAFFVVLLATPLAILADHDAPHTIQQLRERIKALEAQLSQLSQPGGGGGGAPPTTPVSPPITGPISLNGKVGEFFSTSFEAVDGKAPFKWSITKGSLPPGLVLSFPTAISYPISVRCRLLQECPSPVKTILLTGYPREVGSYPFTISVKDKNGNTGNGEFIFFAAERILRNYIKIAPPQPKLEVYLSLAPQRDVAPGTAGFLFSTYKLDATLSGEDIRIAALTLRDTYGGNPPGSTDLQSCQLFDGVTALNNGTYIVNPRLDGVSPDDFFFQFDSPLIVPKGFIKSIDLKCSISISAVSGSAHAWGTDASVKDAVIATGNTSGVPALVKVASSVGPEVKIVGQSILSVSLDSTSPLNERYGIAGNNDVLMTNLKLHAGVEAVELKQIGLVLSGAGVSARDIRKVTLWDGSTKVGEAVFVEGNNRANVVLSGGFVVPKDGDKILSVKADLAAVGVFGGTTGHQIAINYDGTSVDSTYGIGQASGTVIRPSPGPDTVGKGIRLVKTKILLGVVSLPSGNLTEGSSLVLSRFKVTADPAGYVGLYKFTFGVSATDATVSNLLLYGYVDSNFSIPAYSSNPLNSVPVASPGPSELVEIYFNPVAKGANEAIRIPAGGTRYFELRGDTSGVKDGAVVATSLEGDDAYFVGGFTGTASAVDEDANDDFIWSPNTGGLPSLPDAYDWLNGFAVDGLPAGGTFPQFLAR